MDMEVATHEISRIWAKETESGPSTGPDANALQGFYSQQFQALKRLKAGEIGNGTNGTREQRQERALEHMYAFVAGDADLEGKGEPVFCMQESNRKPLEECNATFSTHENTRLVSGFHWYSKHTLAACMRKCFHMPGCNAVSHTPPNHCRASCTEHLHGDQKRESAPSTLIMLQRVKEASWSYETRMLTAPVHDCPVAAAEPVSGEYCHPLLACPPLVGNGAPPIAYMEVPKAACTSFKKWLADNYDTRGGWRGHGTGLHCCWTGANRLKVPGIGASNVGVC